MRKDWIPAVHCLVSIVREPERFHNVRPHCLHVDVGSERTGSWSTAAHISGPHTVTLLNIGERGDSSDVGWSFLSHTILFLLGIQGSGVAKARNLVAEKNRIFYMFWLVVKYKIYMISLAVQLRDEGRSVLVTYDALGDLAFIWVPRRANFEMRHFTLKPFFLFVLIST